MSGHSHGLKIGNIAVLRGLGTGWDETRMKVTRIGPDRVHGTITYIHPLNTHTYNIGGNLRIQHHKCKLAEGDTAPLPPLPKRNEFVEVIKVSSRHLGMQFQVSTSTNKHHNGVVEGIVVFQGSGGYKLGVHCAFYVRDLKIVATIREPRKIFAKDGGWGP